MEIRGKRQNGLNSHPVLLDSWDDISRFSRLEEWTSSSNHAVYAPAESEEEASESHELVLSHHQGYGATVAMQEPREHKQSLYAGDGSHIHPDPHLACLKLGKRHYFEDTTSTVTPQRRHVAGFSIGKRGKHLWNSATMSRCQVEGCYVALVNAKEYHRRHKVCEMHSKAPKVVVLGLEQRFCQQCSRFHLVSEFDESKRSCRRRLAGHNERRRKGSNDSIFKNSCYGTENNNKVDAAGRLAKPPPITGSCALSLLSPKSSDLSWRSGAALRELIAENRAALLGSRQLIFDKDCHSHYHNSYDFSGPANDRLNSLQPYQHHHHHHVYSDYQQQQTQQNLQGWDHKYSSEIGNHLTLDLMQGTGMPFGFMPTSYKTK